MAEPPFQMDCETSRYIDMAFASMEAASWLIAGSRTRLEKSSSDMVSSLDVNSRSTPCWVLTVSVTWLSSVSAVPTAVMVAPFRTRYWFGRRMRRSLPILAPVLAKLSSYWRLIEPTKFSFWWRMRSDSRVIADAVSSVLGMVVVLHGERRVVSTGL